MSHRFRNTLLPFPKMQRISVGSGRYKFVLNSVQCGNWYILSFSESTLHLSIHFKHQFLPQKKQTVFIRMTSSSDSTVKFPKISTPALGSNQRPSQWVPGLFPRWQQNGKSKKLIYTLKLSPCHASNSCQLISFSNHFAFLERTM